MSQTGIGDPMLPRLFTLVLPLISLCRHVACTLLALTSTHEHSQIAGNKEHAQRSHTANKFFHCCIADLEILQQRKKGKIEGPGPRRFTLLGVVLANYVHRFHAHVTGHWRKNTNEHMATRLSYNKHASWRQQQQQHDFGYLLSPILN